MTDRELSTDGLSNNWEFVTWTTTSMFFHTRIVKHREKNLIGTNTYLIQRKYWLIGWVDIAYFSGENVSG